MSDKNIEISLTTSMNAVNTMEETGHPNPTNQENQDATRPLITPESLSQQDQSRRSSINPQSKPSKRNSIPSQLQKVPEDPNSTSPLKIDIPLGAPSANQTSEGNRGESTNQISVIRKFQSYFDMKVINEFDAKDMENVDIQERQRALKEEEERKKNAEKNINNGNAMPKTAPPPPPFHINLDVELYEINTTRHWFGIIGFVRLIFDVDSSMSKGIKVSESKLDPKFVEFSKKENGKYYDVCIEEYGNDGILPLNPKYMFYNSIEEELIYTDLYLDEFVEEVTNEDGTKKDATTRKAIVNIRFKAKLQQKFDISWFPYDRQYLCIKLNARTQYRLLHNMKDIKLPSNYSFMKSPFVSKLAYSLSSFTHVAVFVDLIPYTSAKDDKIGVKFNLGKPLYYTVVDRNPSFYYKSYFIPLTLAFLMMLMILVMNPYGEESFSNRVNAILSLFVALIGMKYVMIQGLSEGEEQTFIDNVMNVSFIFIIILIFDTIGIHVFQNKVNDGTLSSMNITSLESKILTFSVRIPDFVIFIIIFGVVLLLPILHCMFVYKVSCGCVKKKSSIFRPFLGEVQDEGQTFKVVETFFGREGKNRFVSAPYKEEGDKDVPGVFEGFPPKDEIDWIKIKKRKQRWCCGLCPFGY